LEFILSKIQHNPEEPYWRSETYAYKDTLILFTVSCTADTVSFFSDPQDLDAALPLIDKYKEHIVAIGEVRHILNV